MDRATAEKALRDGKVLYSGAHYLKLGPDQNRDGQDLVSQWCNAYPDCPSCDDNYEFENAFDAMKDLSDNWEIQDA